MLLVVQFIQYISLSFADVYKWGKAEFLAEIEEVRTLGIGEISYSTFELLFWLGTVYFLLRAVIGI